MTRCRVYDRLQELEPQPDLESSSNISMLEDPKLKTQMDFSYTIKALRGKKKLG